MEKNVLWSPVDEPGLEHLSLVENNSQISADGLILRVWENSPFRLHYRLYCDGQWRVREAEVTILNDVHKSIRLKADGKGHWTDGAGRPILSLYGCIDADISATPFTNSVAIRRLRLKAGESSELVAAYIAVPELGVMPSRQRYTCLKVNAGSALYRYEDKGIFRGFTADISVDPDGLVLDYPGLFKRLWAR